MKKVISIQSPITEKRKKDIPVLNYEEEREIINKFYLTTECNHKSTLVSEIKNKISGYKQQDIKKKILEEDKLITFDETIEKLVVSKLICKYCALKMKIFYENSREPSQWTLDRIDNSLGHNCDNVVICCLSCNLKRRRLNHDKFLFSQKMKLVKLH